MPPMRSPPAPMINVESTREPRTPLLYWLIVGGTGPPPQKTNFRSMVSERKAACRERKAYEEARKAYREARKAASAEFEAKWPVARFMSSKKQQRLDRRNLGGDGRDVHGNGDNTSSGDGDDDGSNSGNHSDDNGGTNNGIEGGDRDEVGMNDGNNG
ncbi:hypothetical protein F5Y10DRAFT_260383 [Nemania abortiva]|nr:hypothetical protein F5Y10DRAFT_260383 [Nemania abortiva]